MEFVRSSPSPFIANFTDKTSARQDAQQFDKARILTMTSQVTPTTLHHTNESYCIQLWVKLGCTLNSSNHNLSCILVMEPGYTLRPGVDSCHSFNSHLISCINPLITQTAQFIPKTPSELVTRLDARGIGTFAPAASKIREKSYNDKSELVFVSETVLHNIVLKPVKQW